MPEIIDPEMIYVDGLPGIWWPIRAEELTEKERIEELLDQATAGLLWYADTPEAILRLLLRETDVWQIFEPPEGYDAEQQGEWDDGMITFGFKRAVRLESEERGRDRLTLVYRVEDGGQWRLEIESKRVVVERAF